MDKLQSGFSVLEDGLPLLLAASSWSPHTLLIICKGERIRNQGHQRKEGEGSKSLLGMLAYCSHQKRRIRNSLRSTCGCVTVMCLTIRTNRQPACIWCPDPHGQREPTPSSCPLILSHYAHTFTYPTINNPMMKIFKIFSN